MDLNFSPSEMAFRDEVRAFLRDFLPARLSTKVRESKRLTKQDMEDWHAILNARGWLASHWPKEYGGTGWTVVERFIFETEAALAFAPRIVPFGLNMLAPVLIQYGTQQQKSHWLPRILDGDDWWCQGYSEPGAGSDLVSIRTTAVRDGNDYIVNGQKTWTTLAQHANMIFCLVRTDPQASKHRGISFLLIDMTAPGVEVRPIVLLDGAPEVNEIFFTDVRVPAANLVGEENAGWTCAKHLLTYERANIAGLGLSLAAFEKLKLIAASQRKDGRPLADDPLFAARMARIEIELANMQTTNLRLVAASATGNPSGPESSMLKIKGTEIRQEITSLTRRAFGAYAQPFLPEALFESDDGEPVGPAFSDTAAADYFNNRKLSIFGGSNEIQKNIVAKAVMGI